jgi:CBS domain-containing protein
MAFSVWRAGVGKLRLSRNREIEEETMQVKEIMTPKVESIGPDLSLQDCARKMRELDIGALPVWRDGQLLGMITDRDICCTAVADGLDPATTTAGDIMSKNVACCFDDQECSEAAQLMEEKHVRRLAVVNHDQAMVGFLSVDDLARCSHELAGEVLEAAAPVH